MSAKARTRRGRGRVILYTGAGQGKTAAALGLALRAVGHGLRVCVVQFIKSRRDTGEVRAAGLLRGRLEVLPAGCGFVFKKGGTERDREQAARALELARRKMRECDVLVLDEVNCAVKQRLIDVGDVLGLLRARPPQLHVVLTGRDAHRELVRVADTVTRMTKVKHAYDAGRRAVQGVEY